MSILLVNLNRTQTPELGALFAREPVKAPKPSKENPS